MTRWWPSSVRSVRRKVSVLVRPSRIATVRWTCSDTRASWVTMTIVVPSSALPRGAARRPPPTSAVELAGRLVGEERRAGRWRAATAMATRCCSPPDRRSGRWFARSPRPTSSSSSRARGPPLLPSVEDHRQLDVLDRRQVRQQVARRSAARRTRRPAAGSGSARARPARQVVAGDDRPAGRRHVQPAEDVEERGLAAARRADDRDHLAAARRAGRGPGARRPRGRRACRSGRGRRRR